MDLAIDSTGLKLTGLNLQILFEDCACLGTVLYTCNFIAMNLNNYFEKIFFFVGIKCCRNKATAIIKEMAAITMNSLATDGSKEKDKKQFPLVVTVLGGSGLVSAELLALGGQWFGQCRAWFGECRAWFGQCRAAGPWGTVVWSVQSMVWSVQSCWPLGDSGLVSAELLTLWGQWFGECRAANPWGTVVW